MVVALGYFWLIQQTVVDLLTFMFVSHSHKIFGEAVLRPSPAAPGGTTPSVPPVTPPILNSGLHFSHCRPLFSSCCNPLCPIRHHMYAPVVVITQWKASNVRLGSWTRGDASVMNFCSSAMTNVVLVQYWSLVLYCTIQLLLLLRYDTIRDAILTCARKPT